METLTIDIKQSNATVSDLLALVVGGNEIVLEEGGKALARLSPIPEPPPSRIAGLREGQGWVSEDFDDPLPDEFWAGRV